MSMRIDDGSVLRSPRGESMVLVSASDSSAELLLEGHYWQWPRASVVTLVAGLLVDGWQVERVLHAEELATAVHVARERARVLGQGAGRRAA